MTRTILLTGPVQAFDRWREPLESAGWSVETLALLEQVRVPLESVPGGVDWIVFTSAFAIEALGDEPDLRKAKCAVVGTATADVAREAGYDVQCVGTGTGRELARQLLGLSTPRRAFWPRGELALDFGLEMERRGVEIEDAIVYRTEATTVTEPPGSDVVFFASPSAAQVWIERWSPDRVAIAIGPTTAIELGAASWPELETLNRPAPEALRALLARRV